MNWRIGFMAAAAAWCGWCAPATASNATDHWYAPSESGWGLSVTHQGDTAFIVMFVYGPDKASMWVSGTATRYGSTEGGHPGFAGPLYATNGPWHGGPFDPAAVNAVRVGEVTFESTDTNRAILVYSINGVSKSKIVERLTFRYADWSGLYHGAARFGYRNCAPGFVPAAIYDDGFVSVEHDKAQFSMTFEGRATSCTYAGAYEQQGHIGKVTGNYACEGGASGTFSLRGLESHERALGGRIEASHPSCGRVTIDVAGFALTAD
jgi:hypothetical protein